MFKAISKGKIEEVKEFAKDYNELKQIDSNEKTPVEYAFGEKKWDIVTAIINNAKYPYDNKDNLNPDDEARFGAVLLDSLKDKKFDISRLLIKRSKDIGMGYEFQWSSTENDVIHTALEAGAPEDIIKDLIKVRHHKLNNKNKKGKTALEFAKDDTHLVKLLKIIDVSLKEKHKVNPNTLPILVIGKLNEKIINESNINIISSWLTNLGALVISDTRFNESMIDSLLRGMKNAGENCTLRKIIFKDDVDFEPGVLSRFIATMANYPFVELKYASCELSIDNLRIGHNIIHSKEITASFANWLEKNNQVETIELLSEMPDAPCIGMILEKIPAESTEPNSIKPITLIVSPEVLDIETETAFNNPNLSRIHTLVVDGNLLRAKAINKLTQLISQLRSLRRLDFSGIHIDFDTNSSNAWKTLAAAVSVHKDLKELSFLKTNLQKKQIKQLVNAKSIEQVILKVDKPIDEKNSKLSLITSLTQLSHCALKVVVEKGDDNIYSTEADDVVSILYEALINNPPVTKELDFDSSLREEFLLYTADQFKNKQIVYNQESQKEFIGITRLLTYILHSQQMPPIKLILLFGLYSNHPKFMNHLTQADKDRISDIFIKTSNALVSELAQCNQNHYENIVKGLQVLLKLAKERNNPAFFTVISKCQDAIYTSDFEKFKKDILEATNLLKKDFEESENRIVFTREHRVSDAQATITVINKASTKQDVLTAVDDLMEKLDSGTFSSFRNWLSDKPIDNLLELKHELQKRINFDKKLEISSFTPMYTSNTKTSQYSMPNFNPVAENLGYQNPREQMSNQGFPSGLQNSVQLREIVGQGNPPSGAWFMTTNQVQRQAFYAPQFQGQNNPPNAAVPQLQSTAQMPGSGFNQSQMHSHMFYSPTMTPAFQNQAPESKVQNFEFIEESKEIKTPPNTTHTTTVREVDSDNLIHTEEPDYIKTEDLPQALPDAPIHTLPVRENITQNNMTPVCNYK